MNNNRLQEQMNRRRQKSQSRFCEADFPGKEELNQDLPSSRRIPSKMRNPERHPDRSYDEFAPDRKKTMYEPRYPARGFVPNDPILEKRKYSNDSSTQFQEASFSSEEPFVQTNAQSVTNFSP